MSAQSRKSRPRMAAAALGVAASVLAPAGPALNEALPPPPMKPGEVVALTGNGCGVIQPVGTDAAAIAKFREETRQQEWRGPCRNGLAHGSGVMTYPQRGPTAPAANYSTEYFYGRSRFSFFQETGTESFTRDGLFVTITPGIDLDNPPWATDAQVQAGAPKAFIGVNFESISTYAGSCYIPGGDCGPLYKILYSTPDNPFNEATCPDKTSAYGCEGLWRQVAAPYIARYRTLRAQYDAEAPAWRAELSALNAARDARFAALDAASGEAFERSQVSAQAEGGKAEKEFAARLNTANAGQLYAMADEFETAGDTDKARQVLRTLLKRFPDHALAVTAAQRLPALAPGGAGAAAGDCAAPATEARIGREVSAAMSRIQVPTWRYEAIMAGIQSSAAAWSRCPDHPASAAKLRNYRAAYVEAARRCAMISPAGACTPNMH